MDKINIVVTGSTRGIGFGLADALINLDCRIMVSGRDPEKSAQAADELLKKHSGSEVFSKACDVRKMDQIQALWDEAALRFGEVDIWINNAGIAHPISNSWEMDPQMVQAVIETNMLGETFGTIVAMKGMLKQGHGAIYNMAGLGSTGRKVPGLNYYGMTKYALRYFNTSLWKEAEKLPIILGEISPGMVLTDMISSQYENRAEDWEKNKKIILALSRTVDEIAPVLAKKILENKTSGVKISAGGGGKTMFRMLSAFLRR